MNIELTKDQYTTLIKMLYLATWMTESVQEEADMNNEYDRLEQHIFAYAEKFGCEKDIKFDAEDQIYYPTDDFEDNHDLFDIIDGHSEQVLVDELIARLVHRDMVKEFGDKVDSLPDAQRFQKEVPLIEKYSIIYEEKGIDGLM